MAVGDGDKRGFVGGVLRLAAGLLGFRVQLQLVKKHFAHLSGGGNVELGVIGHLADAGFALGELLAEAVGKHPQLGHVHLHAVSLHLGQHLGQGLLHAVVEGGKLLPELVSEGNEDGRFLQARGIVLLGDVVKEGAGSSRGRCLLQRYAQVCLRQGGEFVASLGVDDIVHELDVVPLSLQADALGRQVVRRLFEVYAVLGHGSVFQQVLRLGRDDRSHLFTCGQEQVGTAAYHQPNFSTAFSCRKDFGQGGRYGCRGIGLLFCLFGSTGLCG